jgi:hypothetical protein
LVGFSPFDRAWWFPTRPLALSQGAAASGVNDENGGERAPAEVLMAALQAARAGDLAQLKAVVEGQVTWGGSGIIIIIVIIVIIIIIIHHNIIITTSSSSFSSSSSSSLSPFGQTVRAIIILNFTIICTIMTMAGSLIARHHHHSQGASPLLVLTWCCHCPGRRAVARCCRCSERRRLQA